MDNKQELALIDPEKLKPAVLFTAPHDEGVDKIIADIEAKATALVPDLKTATGRKEVASMAYNVSRCKTFLDEMGKELTAEMKAKCALVDSSRKRCRDRLDALRDKVREPLTKWEAEQERLKAEAERREQERMDYIESIIAGIEAMAFSAHEPLPDSETIANRLGLVSTITIGESFEEFQSRAQNALERVIASIEGTMQTRKNFDAQAAERKAEEERLAEQRRQQEEEQARIDAEKKKLADEQAAEAARIAEERRKIEEEKDAIEREKQLEQARKEAAEKAKQEAEAKAAQEKAEAEEKARQEKEAAEAKAKAEATRKAQLPDKEKLNELAADAISRLYLDFKNLQLDTSAGKAVQKKLLAEIDHLEGVAKDAIGVL